MRFPIGCPVPVGVWRETPPPPDSLSSPKRKGRERRQGWPHATHLGPLAPAFLPFAVFLTNVRAVGPPPHCRLFSSHAFTLLNFPFLNLVLLATDSQISVIRDQRVLRRFLRSEPQKARRSGHDDTLFLSALLLQLTAKGNRYRSVLIQQRRAVDAKLPRRRSPRQFSTLIRQLEVLSGLVLSRQPIPPRYAKPT